MSQDQFNQIIGRLDKLETKIDKRFERVDGQLASLAANQVEMEKRLTARLDRIEHVACGNTQTLSRIGQAFQPEVA